MAMTPEHIEILLELVEGTVRSGQRLRGGFRVTTEESISVKRVEASVLWYTEGKGNMDEGVVWHQTFAENEILDSQRAFPFEAEMPEKPWSYSGKLIKIKWVVRVRIFPENGEEVAAELPFKALPEGRSTETAAIRTKD